MSSQPRLHHRGVEMQEFGTVVQMPLALSHGAWIYSCQRLNRVLADTQMLGETQVWFLAEHLVPSSDQN